jgi:ABC-type amino acid transport substrate-binding protein
MDMFTGVSMRLKTMFTAIATIGLFAGTAAAQEGTLKKIKDTGTITIGHRESSIPFSYYDDKQQVVGYAMDLCNKIVDAVKANLKFSNLEVKLQPVTSATRIPLLANGTTDLECGSTTNNLERQKQVCFTITHFVTANRFVSKKSANLKKLEDLKGKTVVSTSGTTNIKQITELNTEKNPSQHPPGQGSCRGLPDGRDGPSGRFRDGRHPALQPRRRFQGAQRLRYLHRCIVGRAVWHHAAEGRSDLQEGGR